MAVTAGCGPRDNPAAARSPVILRVGFGSVSGHGAQFGIEQEVRNITEERLIRLSTSGRPEPVLADRWTVDQTGLTWRVWLRRRVKFHDGTPATAETIREVLLRRLPAFLGPAYRDIKEVRVRASDELEFVLKQRSSFFLDGLDIGISEPANSDVGTGPFRIKSKTVGRVELSANKEYRLGRPQIDEISFEEYPSVRAAWADMLRGRVDMLFEVGPDALDSLRRTSNVNVFTSDRPYVYLLFLNTRVPALKDPEIRRTLNAAIDRQSLVTQAFGGNAVTADAPLWPHHWAFDVTAPKFQYQPKPLPSGGHERLRIECLILDSSYERVALVAQKQLSDIGVDVKLTIVPAAEFFRRVRSGNFDAVLVDTIQGPGLLQSYQFWYTGAPFNWGGFSSPAVDAALDTIRHAADDDEYRRGVAAFQRAMVNDPPAIFLAWSERARAVSRRFDVPQEPGRDILSTLRLWRPVAGARLASRN